MARVLLVDDEEMMRDSLGAILSRQGHQVAVAKDGEQGEKRFSSTAFDVVITDLKMPKMDGIELLGRIRAADEAVPVIVITAHGTLETAVEAMRLGAFDFVTKPFGADEITARLDKALAHRALVHEARELRELVAGGGGDEVIGRRSKAMQEIAGQIRRVAQSDATVLIHGESGAGKEVAARAIHNLSPRAKGPFLAVNCAALSAGLLESELFGHERGAFTGADRQRLGRFELARGGTLLLDEVSEIDVNLQAKLLRVLQERKFERVGSSESIEADVRVLATTNRDLKEAVREGRFREDLYYRLNVVPLALPPLRERREDIEELARHFLSGHAKRLGRSTPELTPDGLALLKAYPWPGNVRELENLLERICVLEPTDRFDRGVIERYVGAATAVPAAEGGFAGFGAGCVPSIEEVERKLVEFALGELKGDRNAVAQALGITTKTLRAKMQKWEML